MWLHGQRVDLAEGSGSTGGEISARRGSHHAAGRRAATWESARLRARLFPIVGAARKLFRARRPDAVLAMGGFTAAPPVLAARSLRIKTFLHESNTIPGRANRWLARVVDQAFVGFPQAEGRLAAREVVVTGTPVRAEFQSRDAAASRARLGLDPGAPRDARHGRQPGRERRQ
jgi:UDP-N-acetylglucosamine:LPS N-acetylglucosamine transferase